MCITSTKARHIDTSTKNSTYKKKLTTKNRHVNTSTKSRHVPICQLSHYRTDVLSALCVRLRLHVCACTYAPACMRPRPPACTYAPVCAYTPACGSPHPCECLYAPLRVLAGAYPTFCKCLTTRSQLASVMLSGLCTEILPERTSESTESSAIKDHIFSGSENISEAL